MDTMELRIADQQLNMAEFLDHSQFDEKFEVELETDVIRNLCHIPNKYYVPVMTGSFREMYSYAKDYMVSSDSPAFARLLEPDTLRARLQASRTGMLQAECRLKLVDGSYRHVLYVAVSGDFNGVPEGKVYFYVFDLQNSVDHPDSRTEPVNTDNRDPLTGLCYREAFLAKSARLVASGSGPWCCLAIDIQHFKIFNSWFGRDKGSYVLARIGSVLARLEQSADAVAAYFGRDNFGVVLRHDKALIDTLFEQVKEIINSYSNTLGFLPAFGIYLMEGQAQIDLDAYDKARLAVEEAKVNYADRIRYFDSKTYQRKRDEYDLLAEFQDALRNQEISFYIQPQCRIATGQIIGAEALARWIKADGTMIPPAKFVPFLEATGFIPELDKRVWDSVCRWMRSLIDRNIVPVPVSVNISQIDLLSMDVAAYLYGLTERYSLPTRLLKIEITESAYAENDVAIRQAVTELKRKGFTVLMDDFGSGYSSLNMLDKINVDILKLDMFFMRKDTSLSKKGISILESIVSMTKALEIPVIVEGVETEEQITFLSNLGCQYAQGYYFYRPMPAEQYEALIRNPKNVDYEGIRRRITDLFHAREFLSENLFTMSSLNNILGAVAFYTLDGDDLTISRFNEPFYRAIGDAAMDSRRSAIQNYVVEEDRPMLYRALQNAEHNIAEGSSCEVRFYKSDNSVFWFHLHFFYLSSSNGKKLFYGKIEDVSEAREQSLRFFEVLRKQADVTMRMDLDRNIIQYVTGENTLYQVDLPHMPLNLSVQQTARNRIESEADRQAFIRFFDLERLKTAYRKAVYHEVLNINFRLRDHSEPIEFSTYYIRHSKDQNLTVYAFANRRDRELLETDSLTGMKSRYAYNEALLLYEDRIAPEKDLIVFSMDVNGLKSTNDTLGHLAGDEMIRGAADCMGRVLSPYGTCFRTGGDEFVAFLYGSRTLAETLKTDLDKALAGWKGKIVPSVSISAGFVTRDECMGADITEMVRLADRKMYREKSIYYQQQGIDRRMQQAAFNALCSSYEKILKVHLQADTFEIIRTRDGEQPPQLGFGFSFSPWLLNFAMTGRVHPEDKARYLHQTDIEFLRSFFLAGHPLLSIRYRRKTPEGYRTMLMDLLPTQEYGPDRQEIFLYMKDISIDSAE